MILWNDAVIDRNQDDVDKVNDYIKRGWDNLTEVEKEEFYNGLKGALNTSDLERIENNIQLLSDVLELDLSTYYNNIPEYPTNEYFENMLTNVSAIRKGYMIHKDTPKLPESPINDYKKVNDIEKILLDVYEILLNNFHYYCGDSYYAGEEFGLLL